MKKSRIGITLVVAGIFLTMILALTPISSYAASAITLSLDDGILSTDAAPVIKDGRTLVPIRIITENLNCEVFWNAAAKTVNITENDGSKLELVIGSTEGTKTSVDGTVGTFNMDVPASIIGGRTMVPIRAISDNLSSSPQIGWSNSLRKVCIYTSNYLAEKGIDDVNAYVASFKAPVVEAKNVSNLGTWNVEVTDLDKIPVTLIQSNGIKYISISDLLNKVCAIKYSPSISYDIKMDDDGSHARCEYIEKTPNEIASEYIGYRKNIINSRTFDFYTGSNIVKGVLGTDYIFEETDKENLDVIELIKTEYSPREIEIKENGCIAKSRNPEQYAYNNPVIKYNNMLWVPFEDAVLKGPDKLNLMTAVAFKDNVAYVMDDYYMQSTGKTKASIEGTSTTPSNPVQTESLTVGDNIWASAIFMKCHGIVTQISGSKIQVEWTKVTDLLGTVKEYKDIDTLTQIEMTSMGVTLGYTSWIDISKLHKN